MILYPPKVENGVSKESSAKLKGGYYIKARCTQDSEIAHAPPHVREVWDWLLKEANHKNVKLKNTTIKRGHCLRTYKDIQEGLCWYVGYRKEKYTSSQIEFAMKWLTKRGMIAKMKTTRGLLITISNYETYQNPKNYKSHSDNHNKTTMKPHHKQETINKDEISNQLFKFWDSLDIIKHKNKPKSGKTTFKKAVDDILKNYSADEIKTAMGNYSKILNSKDYYFTYRWTVTDFLIRGFEKFKSWEVAESNYRQNKPAKPFLTDAEVEQACNGDDYKKYDQFQRLDDNKWERI